MKTVPANSQGTQIAEFDIDEVLSKAGKPWSLSLSTFSVGDMTYKVNMGSPRYSVFQKSRKCRCCGIIGNRMFLEPYMEAETGQLLHRMNLYAETRYRDTYEPHFVVMTVDHIVPRKNGGPNDFTNLQTLCWPCNIQKDATDLSIEQIQATLFNAYRIYRSSFSVRESETALAPLRRAIASKEKLIKSLDIALDKAQVSKHDEFRARQDDARDKIAKWRKTIEDLLIQAQTSGVVITEDKMPSID